MARQLDEDQAKRELEDVSRFADKNQRLAWRRKKKRIEDLIARLEPLQEAKLAIILEQQPIMDEIEKVRSDMVHECVHPLDYIVHKGDHILCKFCNTKISVKND